MQTINNLFRSFRSTIFTIDSVFSPSILHNDIMTLSLIYADAVQLIYRCTPYYNQLFDATFSNFRFLKILDLILSMLKKTVLKTYVASVHVAVDFLIF